MSKLMFGGMVGGSGRFLTDGHWTGSVSWNLEANIPQNPDGLVERAGKTKFDAGTGLRK